MFEVPQNNKTLSVKSLMHIPEVKLWFENESQNAITASLNRHLNSIGFMFPAAAKNIVIPQEGNICV